MIVRAAVAAYPVAVARLLRGERDLPPSRLLTAWRVIAVTVAVGSMAKLLSILASQWSAVAILRQLSVPPRDLDPSIV